MTILVLVSFAGLILYLISITQFTNYWKNYPEYSYSVFEKKLPSISVVIPFRNEIENISFLLNCIERQTLPKENFEVILVDDNSTDGSEIIAKDFCKGKPNFFYVINNETGKKAALNKGVMISKKELVVTTDADCIIKKGWLETISGFYSVYNPDIIIGLVDINTHTGFFNKFQEIDFLSLVASGAGSCAWGKPIYCNAANLAFKKSLYENINDPLFNKSESGDDTFLLHNAKKDNKKIMLLKSKNATIYTYGLNSLNDYINQRTRWISKSKYYRDTDTIYTSVIVLLMNIISISSFILFATGINFWLCPVLLSLKIYADYSLVKSFLEFYNRKTGLGVFIIMSIIYPINILIIITLTILKKFKWKGR